MDIEYKSEVLSPIEQVKEKLLFFSRALYEGKEITHDDCKVMSDYLCEMADELHNVLGFLKTQETPAATPGSEETGA